MVLKNIEQLYYQLTGTLPVNIEKLQAAGSNREYFRVYGPQQLIAVNGTSSQENNAFIYLSSFFKKKNIPVPEVYTHTDDMLLYLQEDLGDTLLFDAIKEGRTTGRFTPPEQELLKKALQLLPEIQFAGRKELDYTQCYPQPVFNRRSIFWDLNYFKYCFLKLSGIEFSEEKLENDFEEMARILLEEPYDTFMYRDFQSRNIMVQEDNLYLIDFQGGRKGPIYYDVASFVWQAKGNYPESLKKELVNTYLEKVQSYQTVNEKEFNSRLKHFVLFRMLQVLGAYGFRGLHEKKQHFIQSIPFALNNIKELIKDEYEEYPYLSQILEKLITYNWIDKE